MVDTAIYQTCRRWLWTALDFFRLLLLATLGNILVVWHEEHMEAAASIRNALEGTGRRANCLGSGDGEAAASGGAWAY